MVYLRNNKATREEELVEIRKEVRVHRSASGTCHGIYILGKEQ